MVEFSSYLGISFMRTINNKSQRNDRGKCLGWPVSSYGSANTASGYRRGSRKNIDRFTAKRAPKVQAPRGVWGHAPPGIFLILTT